MAKGTISDDDEKDIVDLLEETLYMDGSHEIRRAK